MVSCGCFKEVLDDSVVGTLQIHIKLRDEKNRMYVERKIFLLETKKIFDSRTDNPDDKSHGKKLSLNSKSKPKR